jgi:hypothetical protein
MRELCSVVSKGTRTFCYLDEADAGESAGSGPLLVAIKERVEGHGEGEDPTVRACVRRRGRGVSGCSEVLCRERSACHAPSTHTHTHTHTQVTYGVCMVDPTTGAFRLGQFQDDAQRWRLRTMLTQFSPSEVRLRLMDYVCPSHVSGVCICLCLCLFLSVCAPVCVSVCACVSLWQCAWRCVRFCVHTRLTPSHATMLARASATLTCSHGTWFACASDVRCSSSVAWPPRSSSR